MAQPTAQTDRDLTSISEARSLARRAKAAAPALAELSQAQIDAIVDAMATAVTAIRLSPGTRRSITCQLPRTALTLAASARDSRETNDEPAVQTMAVLPPLWLALDRIASRSPG